MNTFNIIQSQSLADKTWVQEQGYKSKIPVPTSKQIIYTTTDNKALFFDTEFEEVLSSTYTNKYGENNIKPFVEKIQSHVYDPLKEYGIITLKEDVEILEGFLYQPTLLEVFYPETVTEIAGICFKHCEKLHNFTISENITTIGNQAFSDCYSLTEIVVPETVETFNQFIFQECHNLKKAVINAQITELPYNTFYHCYVLDDLTLPDTLETIGEYSLIGCAFKTFIVPENVKNIRSYAFQNCPNLEEIIFNEKLEIINTGIWWGCSNLKRVDFSNTKLLTTFTDFRDCVNLEYVHLPLPSAYEKTNSIFSDCENLKTVVFGNGTETIIQNILYGNHSVENVIIPSSVKTIETNAFSGCLKIKHIELPDELEVIKTNAFNGCSGLEEIIIPASVKEVGSSAFWSNNQVCKKIQILSSDITWGGSGVFPTPVNTLEVLDIHCPFPQGMFSGPYNALKELVFPEGPVNLDSMIQSGATALETLKFSSTIENIRYSSFTNCPSIKFLEIPETIQTIGYMSFAGLSIQSLTIPNGVQVVGNCFMGCKELKYLNTWESDLTQNYGNSFNKLETLVLNHEEVVAGLNTKMSEIKNWLKIYVPIDLLDEYRSTYPDLFAHFYSITGEEITIEEYQSGSTIGEEIGNIPVDKRLCTIQVSESGEFGLENQLADGTELRVIIENIGEETVTITIPDTFKSKESEISIESNDFVTVYIISNGENMYLKIT